MNAPERPAPPPFRDAEQDAKQEIYRAREGTPLRVPVVEYSENDALLLLRGLGRVDYEPLGEQVEAPEKIEEALGKVPWGVVIADRHKPLVDATKASTLLRQKGLPPPFVSLCVRSVRTKRWRL